MFDGIRASKKNHKPREEAASSEDAWNSEKKSIEQGKSTGAAKGDEHHKSSVSILLASISSKYHLLCEVMW